MIDKHFLALCLLAGAVIITDAAFTLGGIRLGYTEANPIISHLMTMIGAELALILVTIFSAACIWALTMLRSRIKEERYIRGLYVAITIVIAVRAFVSGWWIATIGCGIRTLN